MAGEVGEMHVDIFDVDVDWNVAAILQKADESTNAGEIPRGSECARPVTTASTPMPCEAIDNRFIHADHWNAASVEPQQKMTRGAAVTVKRRL
jgi:hypothetical protein